MELGYKSPADIGGGLFQGESEYHEEYHKEN